MSNYKYTGTVDVSKQPNLASLKGRTVLVTGAGSGIGEIISEKYAENGSFVALCDVNEELGKGVEKKLLEKGYNVKFIKCNVLSWEEQLAAFKEAIASSPKNAIDVVVANAGKVNYI